MKDTTAAQLPTGVLLKALGKQADALAQAAQECDSYDKSIVDGIHALARTAAQVGDMALQGDAQDDPDDASTMRDVINALEERMDRIVEERLQMELAARNNHADDEKGTDERDV